MLIVTPDYVTETVAPSEEPVTLAETANHLRVEGDELTSDTALINSLITAAREYCEKYTGRALVERTLRADICAFYDEIRLPHSPIISISSIQYYNTASPSVLTALAATEYDLVRDIVKRNYGGVYPSIYPRLDSVQITYTAGYESTSSPKDYDENVPSAIKAAILLIVGDLYENREAQVVGSGIQVTPNKTVHMLLDSYRVYA